MASRKENLKALFTNTRSRIIIIFTVVVLVVAATIGIIRFVTMTSKPQLPASAAVGAGPTNIQSIPGAINPTAQYAAFQEKQNIQQAQSASKSGGSAIPTIIRSQQFGQGVESVGPQQGKGGVGFSGLAMEQEGNDQKNQWINTLQNSNCSKSSMSQVVNEGASLSVLKAGCSCAQLKDNGYGINQLKKVCSCKALKAAGFNARDFKNDGYTAGQLRQCGFDACQLRNAGFTAQQMKDGGFTDGELKGAGYPDNEIQKASGMPAGITAADIRKAGCGVAGLERLRKAGVTAAAIRRISGCSAAELKAAGFTAKELKNAGFSAAELKNAGFTPEQLKKAGFNARSLLNAGYSPSQLAAAGYTPSEIKSGEAQLPPGVTPEDIKDAGCSVGALTRERLAGISAAAIRQYAGCSAKQLKAAGFSNQSLANAGFTPAKIKATTPVTDSEIRAAGCNPAKLRKLRERGVTAKRIEQLNGCSAAALKAAGYDAKQLLNAGFTPQQLKNAGFTPTQVEAAEKVGDAAIRAAGCNPQKLSVLRKEGVTAKKIRALNGCTAAELKAAGYDAKQLANAGFTPQKLLQAGFSPQQLQRAGLDPSGAIASGRTENCSVASLKAAHKMGVSAATIKQTLGCSAKAMKEAGYTAAELRNAGYTAAELKNAGFDAQQLKNAGFTAKELADAGFNAKQLKNAGYTAGQLKDAGFSASQLKNAGFDAEDLKSAGYTAAQIKKAGYSSQQLAKAGMGDEEASDVSGLSEPSQQAPGQSNVSPIPSIAANQQQSGSPANQQQQLQNLLKQQQSRMADQKYQQEMQRLTGTIRSAANQSLQAWKNVNAQAYVAGSQPKLNANNSTSNGAEQDENGSLQNDGSHRGLGSQKSVIKTGAVMFAVLDTSVNSDQPSPILATLVSGKYKGAKLIGNFNLPSNSSRLVISFNTMSVPGAPSTTPINAYAIDPNTGRTALTTRTNHHYLLRYGSLFASSFLEGFGNAFQSANTTVTIGGQGGVQNTTVQSGIGRSIMENAVIGLATLGKQWGREAQKIFNRPTTVEVCAGTGIGVLFTQDVKSI